MKRIVLILILAAIFSIIAFYFIYPESIQKLWLWIVGLIGVIIAFIQKIGNWIEHYFKKNPENKETIKLITSFSPPVQLAKIVRYTISGNKTLGLIYAQGEFLGFSEEETILPPANYELTIRRNQLFAFEGKLNVRISIPEKSIANDLLITGDKNQTPGSPELIYNALFELVANYIEKNQQAILCITYADSTIPDINN